MGTKPAAGDAGDAWGAALVAYHLHNSESRTVPQSGDAMQGSYLGPSYDGDDVAKRLEAAGLKGQISRIVQNLRAISFA